MKRFLCLIIMMSAISCFAQRVSSQKAEQIAESFFKGQNFKCSVESITAHNNAAGETIYYIVNATPASYAIVPASELVAPVIAWSVNSNFDASMPFAKILEADLTNRISGASMLSEKQLADIQSQWTAMSDSEYSHPRVQSWPEEGTTKTGGWIETRWTQSSPYNKMVPMDIQTNRRSYAGCPAITMGQIINYLKTTQNTRFDDGDDYHHNYPGRNYYIDDDAELADFPSFPELNYWLDSVDVVFSKGTDATDSLAAAIVFACGTACTQVYTSSASGTYAVSQAYDAYKRFGFVESELFMTTSPEMYATLNDNLMMGLPAHLAVVDASNSTGHNVDVDGYRDDGYYHINFGWGGSSDGWWLLPDPSFPYGLSVLEGIVLNIIPDNWGVAEMTSNDNNVFYPNPADDVIYLKDGFSADCEYTIFTISGQSVQSGRADGKIFVGDLSTGLYLLQLRAEGKTRCAKVMVR